MKIRTPYNGDKFPKKYEVNNQPSMTIPDQTMSVKEIMDRYARGLPLQGVRVPIYEGEESEVPPNWDKMDISEQKSFQEEHRKKVDEMKKDLLDQQNKTGKYKPKPKEKTEEKSTPPPAAPSAASQQDSKSNEKPQ